MKVSFITTIFNEEETIEEFLNSVFAQTKIPDEIIIVDGGSTDTTVEKIKDLRLKIKDFRGKFIILTKKGNRAVGRNEAIIKATGDVIVCTDAGNTVDENWVRNIIKPFRNNAVDVVAGYYKALATTVFQKCVVPYAFVMPDKVDPQNFLPATRSVAFTKKIWEEVGKFDERLTHNEDYAFAKALQKAKAKIVFRKDAIVYWMPRATFKSAYIMMLRFAYGDVEARILRPKVILVFLRYFIGIILLVLFSLTHAVIILYSLLFILILYLVWAVWKNYRYVNEWNAFYFLPLLQLTADWAVLKGTTLGLVGRKLTY